MLRHLRLLLATATLALALAPTALADDGFEPNDTIATAYGPLNGEELFAGELASAEDRDWFWFETASGGPFSLTLSAAPSGACSEATVELTDVAGKLLARLIAANLTTSGATLERTAIAREQYAVTVSGSAGCAYDLSADPAARIAVRPAGAVAYLGGVTDGDTQQRVSVNGTIVGSTVGSQGAWFELGPLAPDARVTFESENAAGDGWGWNARLTNTVGDTRTLVFAERAATGTGEWGGDIRQRGAPRVGVVRHVVLTPSGAVVESCGELAPPPCFPVDNDLDGIPDATDQCSRLPGVASAAGCPDRDGDTLQDSLDACPDAVGPADVSGCPDGDGDKVADRLDQCLTFPGTVPSGCPGLKRYRSVVSLRHRGRRFTGKLVTTAPTCVAGRSITLKRVRGGKAVGKALGTAKTGSKGTFTVIAKKPGRGPFKVAAAEIKLSPAVLCRAGSSKVVR